MDNTAIRSWVEAHREEMLRDIAALVAIPSVSEPCKGKYPYGEHCARVLDTALEISAGYGFDVQNHEYHCGTARLPGTAGNENGAAAREIGVFAHLDIVPEGGGWTGDPFRMEERDGWMVGRGVADNKGPAIAGLYAARCLRDLGIKLRHDLLLWFGCNEEKGMHDAMWYRERFPLPAFSITPDTSFPVCNGEKGILELDASCPLPGTVLADFQAGLASNIVPDEAFALLKSPLDTVRAAFAGTGCAVEELGDAVKVSAKGVAGHAAKPEGTRNAMMVLAAALAGSGLLSGAEQRCAESLARLFADSYGGGIGAPLEDEASGKLTHNGGMTRLEGGRLRQNINIRYPVTADREAMLAAIRGTLESAGFTLDRVDDDPPCFTPADSPVVQTLNNIACQVLGQELDPYVMGGGTYARKLTNAVGFGPGVPGLAKPFGDGKGGAHQPDECTSVQGLMSAVEIYVQALAALDTLVDES